MQEEILVQVENLSRSYGPHLAVDNISFHVSRGEVLGFLGPNGAGKSSTMQMLTGNLAPSLGKVMINGADMLDQPLKAKAAIGYLPEHPPLYRELTVNEYLRYAARLNRIASRDIGKAVTRAKARCGLADMGKRLINNLSKGYQQRVGIAQAVIHSPPVVVLDEPTVGLDPLQIRQIRSLIRELSDEHSVIISTHILPEVQATCDRVQIIHHGSLVLSDSIDGLTRKMQSNSLIVGLRQPPADNALAAIDHISQVESLGEQRWRLQFDTNHQQPESTPDTIAEAVATQAAEHGWGLFELAPEHLSLEQIFVDITRSDDAHPQEAA